MTPFELVFILVLAGGGATGLVFIGVLIQWSLRKARSSRLQPVEATQPVEAVPEAEPPVIVLAAEEFPHEITEPSAAVEPEPPVAPPAPLREPVRIGLGLRKTRENFLARIRAALTGSAKIDEIYEGLEEALIAADVGVDASMKIAAAVRAKMGNDNRPDAIRDALKTEIATIMMSADRQPADSGAAPLVILLVGVNGVGKTTTVAKLAARLKAERGSVIVAAADTFRAAAIEQLQVWGERTKSPVIAGAQGSDSASLAFNALSAAREGKLDVLLIDTAGRLQNKAELMNELEKVVRVIKKIDVSAPHAVLLVLDATVGQNALSQVEAFHRTAGVTGLVMTKLDGTARGGILVALAEKFKLPVHFIGVGEGIDDLAPFAARDFARALAGLER